jgi:hypothetical protein
VLFRDFAEYTYYYKFFALVQIYSHQIEVVGTMALFQYLVNCKTRILCQCSFKDLRGTQKEPVNYLKLDMNIGIWRMSTGVTFVTFKSKI